MLCAVAVKKTVPLGSAAAEGVTKFVKKNVVSVELIPLLQL